jgi:Domain of unknown function (DUF4382)
MQHVSCFTLLSEVRAARSLRQRSHNQKPAALLLHFLIFACFALMACSGGQDSNRMASLTIDLTDAPGPFERVDVTIVGIGLHRTGAPGDAFTETLAAPVRIDLLSLQSGRELRMAVAAVPSGNYDALRIDIADPSVTVLGATRTLVTANTSVRVPYLFQVADYDDRRMLLDFDARASILESAQGVLSFKPAIAVKRELSGRTRP